MYMYMYMCPYNSAAWLHRAKHGRQSPDPDPRVFAWGREGVLLLFLFSPFYVFPFKNIKSKIIKPAPFWVSLNYFSFYLVWAPRTTPL